MASKLNKQSNTSGKAVDESFHSMRGQREIVARENASSRDKTSPLQRHLAQTSVDNHPYFTLTPKSTSALSLNTAAISAAWSGSSSSSRRPNLSFAPQPSSWGLSRSNTAASRIGQSLLYTFRHPHPFVCQQILEQTAQYSASTRPYRGCIDEVAMPKDSPTEPSDPSDFLSTSPLVANFDQSLRCQICKDFFDTPMITSCCHTFCSLCIRQALSTDGRCPICRQEDQPIKLRRNWAIQEVVATWKNTRRIVLTQLRRENEMRDKLDHELLRQRQNAVVYSAMTEELNEQDQSRKRKRDSEISQSSMVSRYPKRTSRIEIASASIMEDVGSLKDSTNEPIVISASEYEDDGTEPDVNTSKESGGAFQSHNRPGPAVSALGPKSTLSGSTIPTALTQSSTQSDPTVSCPVCGLNFKQSTINLHLDKCLDSGGKPEQHLRSDHQPSYNQNYPQQRQVSRTFGASASTSSHSPAAHPTPVPAPQSNDFHAQNPSSTNPLQQMAARRFTVRNPHTPDTEPEGRRHLPFLNYPSYKKDGDLRRKLAALGIPTTGSRWLLEKRHTYWVNLWNANVDAANGPETARSVEELLRELADWEKAVTGAVAGEGLRGGPTGGPSSLGGGPGPMDKGFDRTRWREEHTDQFGELISQARATLKANADPDEKLKRQNQKVKKN